MRTKIAKHKSPFAVIDKRNLETLVNGKYLCQLIVGRGTHLPLAIGHLPFTIFYDQPNL